MRDTRPLKRDSFGVVRPDRLLEGAGVLGMSDRRQGAVTIGESSVHGTVVRRRTIAWVQRPGWAALVVVLLLGGLGPAVVGWAASAGPPVPFEAWRVDDEMGRTRSLGYPASRTAWGLAEFAPGADVDVSGVEFWTTDAATDVDLYLYDSFDGRALGSRLAAKLDSTFDGAGTHSVGLESPVPVAGGDQIVVVLKITNASRGHPLLLDGEERDDRVRTFASPNGTDDSWYDVGAGGHGALAISLGAEPASADPAIRGEYQVFLPLLATGEEPASSDWVVIVKEGFEGDFPGEWQLRDGDPAEGLHVFGPRTCRAYSGSHSGWVVGGGSGAGLGCQSAYPRHVRSWMVFGPFSLADASAAELGFQLWLNSEPRYDGVFSGASIDGLEFHGHMVTGNSAGWVQEALDLRAVPELGDLAGQEEVWIALLFVSDGVVRTQQGAFIDDIVLQKYVGSLADLPEESTPAPVGPAQREEATFSLRR